MPENEPVSKCFYDKCHASDSKAGIIVKAYSAVIHAREHIEVTARRRRMGHGAIAAGERRGRLSASGNPCA